MLQINQKGAILPVLMLLLLVGGVGLGTYLIQQKTNLSPKAQENSTYIVKPYLVYPSDKPMYPEYEEAVKKYMDELQGWYGEQVGKTFEMQPLQVVRSQYTYDTMRCDPNPDDSTLPSTDCLNNPNRLEGNWGAYMNKAIHNGVERWDEQTATLVFSAGGGGYAGANKLPNDTGWAISGDWVLEPISGKANEWGIPCRYSDGWQCSGGVPKGTPAHELGHAFGLPHPGSQYAAQTIMEWHGNYPGVGFIKQEVDYLKNSPFFKLTPSSEVTLSSLQKVDCNGKYPQVRVRFSSKMGPQKYEIWRKIDGVTDWQVAKEVYQPGTHTDDRIDSNTYGKTAFYLVRVESSSGRMDSETKQITVPTCGSTVAPTPTPKPSATPTAILTGTLIVKGTVYRDFNGNGVLDSGDKEYADSPVYLHNPDGSKVLAQFRTTGGGNFAFYNLAPGIYRITHFVPPGYSKTTDDSFSFELNSDKTVYFGIKPN